MKYLQDNCFLIVEQQPKVTLHRENCTPASVNSILTGLTQITFILYFFSLRIFSLGIKLSKNSHVGQRKKTICLLLVKSFSLFDIHIKIPSVILRIILLIFFPMLNVISGETLKDAVVFDAVVKDVVLLLWLFL